MLQIAGLYSEPQLIYTPRFLVYTEKYLTLEFVTVSSGPSIQERAWLNAKFCRVSWEVVIWFRNRNSSSTFQNVEDLSLFLFSFSGG